MDEAGVGGRGAVAEHLGAGLLQVGEAAGVVAGGVALVEGTGGAEGPEGEGEQQERVHGVWVRGLLL